ncbi:hypothetical protein [Candidatus Magnetomonas plexicatena]|uniref:hypothetical protein n=1 Tax=Candidatus Magnetomonas plexicatena TaxID=2552947 RepID=UPI001C766FF8|nr:hypothetical protein E2O03_006500 [Nitrospirales bacterium LBB_01]
MLLKDMTVEQLEDLIDKKFNEKLNDFFFDIEDYMVALDRYKTTGRKRFTTQEIKEQLGF